jgi:hypothetical protein
MTQPAIAANYLEITVGDPVTHGEGRTRYTDFRMEMKTNMPVFKVAFHSTLQEQAPITLLTLALSQWSGEGGEREEALLAVQVVERRGGQDGADKPAQVGPSIVFHVSCVFTR